MNDTLKLIAELTALVVALQQFVSAVVAVLPASAFKTRLGAFAARLSNLTPKDSPGTLKLPGAPAVLPHEVPEDQRVTGVPLE